MSRVSHRLMQICESLSLLDEDEIEKAVGILQGAKDRNNFVWIIGNGGSAATASHFANDLLKMRGVKAIDLGSMTPLTLACGNDLGWENMFSVPLKRLAVSGDVLISISCSGNSENILNAARSVNRECYRIAITGPDGKLSEMENDACIRAMADEITVQEDVHSIVCHEISQRIRNV